MSTTKLVSLLLICNILFSKLNMPCLIATFSTHTIGVHAPHGDAGQQVLANVAISFPFQIMVFNGTKEQMFNIVHRYLVEGLHLEATPKVTQKFIVTK